MAHGVSQVFVLEGDARMDLSGIEQGDTARFRYGIAISHFKAVAGTGCYVADNV